MFYSLEEALEYYREHDCHEHDNFDEVFETHDWHDEHIDGIAWCKDCGMVLSYGTPGTMMFYDTLTKHTEFSKLKCSLVRMYKAIRP